ncbi:hypothetical protein M0802_007352 [Mischocyttarus mexicanus]|nr:hypothetical protein M0802_007352 [Mischocyttarus mexicanus]
MRIVWIKEKGKADINHASSEGLRFGSSFQGEEKQRTSREGSVDVIFNEERNVLLPCPMSVTYPTILTPWEPVGYIKLKTMGIMGAKTTITQLDRD